MKSRFPRYVLILVLVAMCTAGYSQKLIEQEWEAFYTHQDSIFNVSTDLDANGDVYVTGYVNDLTEGRNIVTLKYDVDGNLLWSNDYHWGSDDRGFRNLCDASGNVYTLGRISNGATSSLIVIKYDAAGNQLWDFSHTIGTTNEPSDMLINSNGNIVILGDALVAGQHDVIMVEVNPSGGMVANYQFDSGSNDFPVNLDMVVGKIAVGVIIDNGMSSSTRIIQLNNGLTIDWFKDLAHDPLYIVKSVKYDQNGDVLALINQSQLYNQAVLYKHSALGDSLWTKELDGGNTYEIGKCLFVDGQNNAITTYVNGGGLEVSVHLVDENGVLQWNKYYYSSGLTFKNFAVVSDDSRIIVAGSESNLTSSNMVMYSLDYNAVLRWQHRENGTGGNRNTLTDFDFNTNDHIVMTGQIRFGALFQIAVFDLAERDAFNAPDASTTPDGHLSYFRNYNQIKNYNGAAITGLEYSGQFNDNGHYLFNKTLSHTRYLSDGDSATTDSIVRWDFVFTGDFAPVSPTGINSNGYYANFYYKDLKRERVDAYDKVVYPSVYPNIDIEMGGNANGNVIYFVVYPDGDYHDIEFIVSGANAVINPDGSLSCDIAGHTQTYEKPIVYQLDNTGNPSIIPYTPAMFGYQMDGAQTVSFDFPGAFYNNDKPFVIEMQLSGTHQTKSTEDNFNWCSYIRVPAQPSFQASISKIATDDLNNTYYAGNVYDNNSALGVFPTTSGVPFPMSIGEDDITILKLSDDIEIQWATYYGGTATDYATSVTVTPTGNEVFVAGSSASLDFPTAPGSGGAYVNGSIGQSFIVQLHADGTANWATKFELAGDLDGTTYLAGIRDCEIINSKLYVVGSRAGISPITLPDDGANYYSATGSGFIGVFKFGGEYVHGTGFGGTGFVGEATTIYGIDWNGINNIALTGATNDPTFVVTAAPTGHDSYQSANPNYSNAFIANIKTNGIVDFAYYISSVAPPTQNATLSAWDFFYYAEGDRGNDVKFSPDGTSIYVVGEVYGEQLDVVQEIASPNSYFQSSRHPAFNGSSALRPAGFIFKTDVAGNILLSTYFSASEPIEVYSMVNRLQEIAFDNLGNYFITGFQFGQSVQTSPIPSSYNIPIPSTQPLGFYQKNAPTHSTLTCFINGIDRESYIIGFNSNDEHIWSTYVSGYSQDQIKPVAITSNNHLYFAGYANTINNSVDFFCPGESNFDKDQVKFPYWEFDLSIGSADWYNPNGANDKSEFAGRFDITGVNNPGPVLATEELPQSGGLIVYPNPNVTGQLYVYIGGEAISSVRIYSMDGKLILELTESNIATVDISQFTRGTYAIQCLTNNATYNTMFVVQ